LRLFVTILLGYAIVIKFAFLSRNVEILPKLAHLDLLGREGELPKTYSIYNSLFAIDE
jgi:hypothetical protein